MITIELPCKSYTLRYLENNYGSPVNFNNTPLLKRRLRQMLRKPSHRWDKTITEISRKYYPETARIVISTDDFYRFGWELSRTDIVALNTYLESVIKFQMRQTVAAYQLIMPTSDAIYKFREKYNYTEDDWAFDAIKKDLQRNTTAKPSIIKNILNRLADEMHHKNNKNHWESCPHEGTHPHLPLTDDN
jgi:hypothetical protein